MRNEKMKKFILIYGDPPDGFNFIGPFDSHDDALRYAERYSSNWWIAALEDPLPE